MSRTPAVEQAIAEYTPPQMPDRDDVLGVVVVIDPVGGAAASAGQRARDDLALMMGSHLYHLVQHAGGVPVMTRADDRPAPNSVADAAVADVTAARRAICDQHRADLVVTVEFTDSAGAEVSPLVGDRLSQALAQCLAKTIEAEVRLENESPSQSASDPGVPSAVVRLTGPELSDAGLDRRTCHREWAQRVYLGIASFFQTHGPALENGRTARRPGCGVGPARPVPYLPDQTWEEELHETARRIWPEGDLPIERAAWFGVMLRQTVVSDGTFVFFQPQVSVDGSTVVVSGATNIVPMRDTLADALRAVGVRDVRNEMSVLPEEGRLGDRRFGVCVANMALTFDEPSEAAGPRSQLLYGEPLLLLDHHAGYYLLHGDDGYWGWVREDSVRVMLCDEFRRYTADPPAVLLRDVEQADRRVVQGARLPVASALQNTVTLLCPDGVILEVASDDVRVEDDSRTAGDRIAKALALLHRPYVFGGVSPLGLDCSGLVRNVCAQTGLATARDSSQQFLHGRLAATRWHHDDLRPGDLLYFINMCGRIYHVGIALSPTHFVHCAPPEVGINSLKVGDRLYCEHRERAFFAAKRVC